MSFCLNVVRGKRVKRTRFRRLLIVNAKPLILRHPEQVLARPVSLMRWFQLEQFWPLLRVEENPEGKTTRHRLWRVKDIPHAACSWTRAVVVRGECVTMAPLNLMLRCLGGLVVKILAWIVRDQSLIPHWGTNILIHHHIWWPVWTLGWKYVQKH